MIKGNSLRVYLGLEKESDAYGVNPAPMTHRIKVASESLQAKYNKKDEGLLTGGIATGKVGTMSKKVEGALSTLLRPDDAGLLLYLLCGKETTATPDPAAQSVVHTFEAIGNKLSDSLPSCTIGIDRTVQMEKYTGCKVNTLSVSAQKEDYIKVDLNFIGARKIVEEIDNADALKPSTQSAYKFLGGEFKIENVHVADVTSMKLDYNNNLDADTMTMDSGEYNLEPECGARDIKIEVEVLYSKASAHLAKKYYDTDDDFSLSLHFASAETSKEGKPFTIDIELAAVQLTDCTNNVGGADKVIQKMSMKAIENFIDPLIAVSVYNNETALYRAE